MAWLIWRELVVATRTPAVWMALATNVSLLACLLLIWGDGVPVMTGTPFDQFARIQWAAATLLFPWLVCRLAGSRNELAVLAAFTGRSVSDVLVARVIAAAVVLQTAAMTTLPLAAVAALVTDVDPTRVVTLFTSLGLLSAIVVTISIAATLVISDRVGAWIVATVAVGFSLTFVTSDLALMLGVVASTVLLGTLTRRANRIYRYATSDADGGA